MNEERTKENEEKKIESASMLPEIIFQALEI